MKYEKKYRVKKDKLILDLTNAFKKSNNLLNRIDLHLKSIDFENGRNKDDFIVVKLLNKEQSKIKIIFWIDFWMGYEFENSNLAITYELYEQNECVLRKKNVYNELSGNNLDEKIYSLVDQISNLWSNAPNRNL